jgi:hypothetical protein
VVTGLAGARIPASTLVEGRTATIVGIVRRPYPGATDRRWSIAPRSPADVTVGPAGTGAGGSGSGGGDGGSGNGVVGQPGTGAIAGAAGSGATVPDVDLVDLAGHVGQVVRVGGLVTELAPDGFLLDDGTAIGRVALTGAAAEYLPLLEPGDALNATGRVEGAADAYRVVVDDPAGLVRVGDPTLDQSATTPLDGTAAELESAGPVPASRLAGGLLGPDAPGAAGVVGIMLISAASLAVTVLRRRRAQRRTAARVAARLASVTATHGPDR